MPAVGRHHAEIAERLLAPAQKLVALAVAIEFLLGVDQEGGIGARFIDLNRVVDHQVDGLQGVDTFRGAAEAHDGVAHGGQVDDSGDAGEVLKKHTAGAEGDFLLGLPADVPSGECFDVRPFDERVVLVPQEILEENAQCDRKALDGRIRKLRERAQS